VLLTEHKLFFVDIIYALDSYGGTGQGTIEVYNTTLGGVVLTWTPAFSTSINGAQGIVVAVGTVVRISDNAFKCSQSVYVCIVCSRQSVRTAHKF
jgi:hypothetical protein